MDVHPAASQMNWNDSFKGDYLWSSVNFGEAVTEVMTPLTWSVMQFTLEDWVFLPGMPTVGIIGGRPYLNISIFATLFYKLGRSRKDLLDYMESTLYMRLPDEMSIPSIAVSPVYLLRGILCSLQVQLKQKQGVRKTPAYVNSNGTWFENLRKAIQSATSKSGLHRIWHTEMKSHLQEGAWCVLGSAPYSAEYTLQLRRQLEKLVGPEDANILIGNLSENDTPLESLGPIDGLHKLANGEISRTAYLEAYGHRGPQEFELSVPRPAEDSLWLERELEKIGRSGVDFKDLRKRQRRSFEAAMTRLESRSAKEVGHLRRKISESARRARLRELARSAYVRDRWAVRIFALRAGELSGIGDQVFFLTLGELLRLLIGERSYKEVIEQRAEDYQQYKSLPPYPAVIRGQFDPFTWAASPQRPTDIFDASMPEARKVEFDRLIGSPGSTGVVEGTVRVIDNPETEDLLQTGEILVAVQTDIAWTLLFPRAAAVITDIGAPLSHAAIVARELGIPAVVGCGKATAVLKTGDRVRVDGGRGIVEILS